MGKRAKRNMYVIKINKLCHFIRVFFFSSKKKHIRPVTFYFNFLFICYAHLFVYLYIICVCVTTNTNINMRLFFLFFLSLQKKILFRSPLSMLINRDHGVFMHITCCWCNHSFPHKHIAKGIYILWYAHPLYAVVLSYPSLSMT
jgi:hypothetical protein